jgi:hypothetical protein
MKKTFCVSVDVTMAKNIYVQAEDEEQAMEIASNKIDVNPYGYAQGFSHYVGYEIIDAVEED